MAENHLTSIPPDLAPSHEKPHDSTAPHARRPILVCEDDEGIRELLVEALEEEGFEVYAARNGREALDFLRSGPGRYLLLLDLMMPDISGYEILEQMSKDDHLLGENVVVVLSATGFVRQVSPKVIEKRLVQAMLKKPFELDELFAILHRLA